MWWSIIHVHSLRCSIITGRVCEIRIAVGSQKWVQPPTASLAEIRVRVKNACLYNIKYDVILQFLECSLKILYCLRMTFIYSQTDQLFQKRTEIKLPTVAFMLLVYYLTAHFCRFHYQALQCMFILTFLSITTIKLVIATTVILCELLILH